MNLPPPAHAAVVWTNGSTMFVRFEDEQGAHTITLPLSLDGLTVFQRALRDRHTAYANGREAKLATDAARTQAQIDALLRGMEPKRIPMGVSGLPEPEPAAKRPPKPKAKTLTLDALDDIF